MLSRMKRHRTEIYLLCFPVLKPPDSISDNPSRYQNILNNSFYLFLKLSHFHAMCLSVTIYLCLLQLLLVLGPASSHYIDVLSEYRLFAHGCGATRWSMDNLPIATPSKNMALPAPTATSFSSRDGPWGPSHIRAGIATGLALCRRPQLLCIDVYTNHAVPRSLLPICHLLHHFFWFSVMFLSLGLECLLCGSSTVEQPVTDVSGFLQGVLVLAPPPNLFLIPV